MEIISKQLILKGSVIKRQNTHNFTKQLCFVNTSVDGSTAYEYMRCKVL